MIRQIIVILFVSYVVCFAADPQSKIGEILDKFCSKRAASFTAARIEKDKADKITSERDENNEDDIDEYAVSKADANANSNRNTNRKMYYAMDDRFLGDDSYESSEENFNKNFNTNLNSNLRRRRRPIHIRRVPGLDRSLETRRMMNGLRRKLSRY